MMMLPNSKPRAAGTPRSQPDAGVYPQTAPVNPRQDFLTSNRTELFIKKRFPARQRDTKSLLVGDFCSSSDVRSRFKTHSPNIVHAG